MKALPGALKRRFAVPRNAWVDTLVLSFILAGINSFLSPYDPGWLRLNPSPLYLLPVLIGCRYGFAPGVLGGVIATLITIAGQMKINGIPWNTIVSQNGYFFGALVVVGGICGEVQNYFRTRESQLNALYEHSKEKLKKLDTDLIMLREGKAELERILATRDAELSTLDMDLRRLFDSDEEELYQNLLLLLNRHSRVSDGAYYALAPEGKLIRKSLFGHESYLPPEILVQSVEMVSLAFKHKTTVTIPEFWQRSIGQHKNYLIVVPLMNSNEEIIAALIVTGMPFIALNKKTVHLITLICRWASRILEIRTGAAGAYRIISGIESQRLFTPGFLKQTLELAFQSFLQHNLPSSLVLFSLPGEPASRQDEFEKVMMTFMRAGDFPATVGLNVPHLVVLLPLTGERGASVFLERISLSFEKSGKFGSNLQTQVITFDQRKTMEQIWEELTCNENRPVAA